MNTNIPETTLCFAGRGVDFGDPQSDQASLPDQTNQIQAIINGTGNRCGHDPKMPRFFNRPETHKSRPHILESAIAKLKDVYRQPKKFVSRLVTTHLNHRQKRSERREAVASVAQVILHYLDLKTLQVGFYADLTRFISFDLKYIAKRAGLSVSRAKRAMIDLAKAGYIQLTRQFLKKDDGTFQGSPSIRTIKAQFFIDLGIDVQKLLFARDWKRKKEEKAQSKGAMKKLRGMMQAATSFGGRVISSIRKQNKPSIDKNLIGMALELHKANPSQSCSDYLKELQRQKE